MELRTQLTAIVLTFRQRHSLANPGQDLKKKNKGKTTEEIQRSTRAPAPPE